MHINRIHTSILWTSTEILSRNQVNVILTTSSTNTSCPHASMLNKGALSYRMHCHMIRHIEGSLVRFAHMPCRLIPQTHSMHGFLAHSVPVYMHAAHHILYYMRITLQHVNVLTLTLLQTAVGSKHPTCAERMTLKGPYPYGL